LGRRLLGRRLPARRLLARRLLARRLLARRLLARRLLARRLLAGLGRRSLALAESELNRYFAACVRQYCSLTVCQAITCLGGVPLDSAKCKRRMRLNSVRVCGRAYAA